MTEFPANPESISAAEALVRAAGDYVRPSENMRPRVLEGARTLRNERRALRGAWHLALVVTLLGMFTNVARTRSVIAPPPGLGSPISTAPRLDDSNAASRQGEFGWDAVESFRELRRQQAELLRLAM